MNGYMDRDEWFFVPLRRYIKTWAVSYGDTMYYAFFIVQFI